MVDNDVVFFIIKTSLHLFAVVFFFCKKYSKYIMLLYFRGRMICIYIIHSYLIILYKKRRKIKDVEFTELFAGKPYDCVQLHSAQIISYRDQKDVAGFFGAFSWDGEKITPLDHDTYSEEMLVIGYDLFTNPDAGVNNGLEIIV